MRADAPRVAAAGQRFGGGPTSGAPGAPARPAAVPRCHARAAPRGAPLWPSQLRGHGAVGAPAGVDARRASTVARSGQVPGGSAGTDGVPTYPRGQAGGVTSTRGPAPASAAASSTAAAAAAPAAAPQAPLSSQPSSSAPAVVAATQTVLLQPVTFTDTVALPPQPGWQQAAAALRGALADALPRLEALSSGVVRFEVPLPRGCSAARWLRGQDGTAFHQVYFSGRHSTAPETPKSALAEAAARGWTAVAGLGAAWLWRGAPGEPFAERQLAGVQRMLSEAQPRIRVLGGTRFDAARAPAPEWEPFGSFCFLLPQAEYLEAADCALLSLTVAWDGRYISSSSSSSGGTGSPEEEEGAFDSSAAGEGPATAADAARRAAALLEALAPPAPPSAPAPAPAAGEPEHAPARDAWGDAVGAALSVLSTDDASRYQPTFGLAQLDTEMAKQEFIAGGQQGLDDLLAALGGGGGQETAGGSGAAGAGPVAGGVQGAGAAASSSASINGTKASSNGSGSATAAAASLGDSSSAASAAAVEANEKLIKLVLARRTAWPLARAMPGVALLEALQERDPRAYQLYLSVPGGGCFVACTPERLYVRSGPHVASEAVAGTRPRGAPGDVEADFYLGLDLLKSAKDHSEFSLTRDWIRRQLAALPGAKVEVEVAKSVLKLATVQHLYGRMAATLPSAPGAGANGADAALLAALHPTPAVCGRPQGAARAWLTERESFDRGYYAGPFGWVTGQGAEFVVAIRSALLPAAGPVGGATNDATTAQQPRLLAYAGVGVVRGSDPEAEWQELCLKARQFERLIAPRPALGELPNAQLAWAAALVEELCRLGVSTFCVAPGSRSSPLALAAARHPRAQLNVCIDERSLAFWALGYGRAAGVPAAVITSSGTAVANLLPAVVEASLSGVPMVLLTADRPFELRDTGANQTIDQVKIFGGYVRWAQDISPPTAAVPGRAIITTTDTAVRYALGLGAPPGPVHLNLQFREPLAPAPAPWDPSAFVAGLGPWQAGAAPFTRATDGRGGLVDAPVSPSGAGDGSGASAELLATLRLLRSAQRGLLVVGELIAPQDVAAAAKLGQLLGWPVAADVLSGLRVGALRASDDASGASDASNGDASDAAAPAAPALALVSHMDHLLLGDKGWWGELRPDVVLQIGPHLTSKRLNQFLEWSANADGAAAPGAAPPTAWVYAGPSSDRHDAAHLVTHRVIASPAELCHLFESHLAARRAKGSNGNKSGSGEYARLLLALDAAADAQIDTSLSRLERLSEMHIARALAAALPAGHGLFLGNSMPIRDMEMYGCPQRPPPPPTGIPAAAAPPVRGLLGAAAAANGVAAAVGPASARGTAAGGQLLGSIPLAGGSVPAAPSSSATATASTAAAAVAASRVPGAARGAPVGANRGASGIDGVLSTAAGFAQGLARPSTLVVGDLSFLHDINGLNLLRGGEMRPPLTVVLVNNGGGGIFSFLPVAGVVERDTFERLWGTPQNVDLEGMCRAQGVPHQRVTAPEDLPRALRAAWGLNRHSVVEVVTSRTDNFDLHKALQSDVAAAVRRAHALLTTPAAAAAAAALAPPALAPALAVASARVSRYRLPLARPVTTGADNSHREGVLFTITLSSSAANTAIDSSLNGNGNGCVAAAETALCSGTGEAAPLPGLSRETADEAAAQLQTLAELLQGARLPVCLPLLGVASVSDWLRRGLGVAPEALHPSVRTALESALLSAIARARGCTLSDLLSTGGRPVPNQPSTGGSAALNALLSCTDGPPAAAAAEAASLVAAGYRAIKIKVGRRSSPLEDAEVVLAVREAVGPDVILRADANRAWSLSAALEFGRRAGGAGLQYVEEPTADPFDMGAFFLETGIPVALDESLDEGLAGPLASEALPAASPAPSPPGSVFGSIDESAWGAAAAADGRTLPQDAASGLGGVVIKPTAVGGLEAAWRTADWAAARGAAVVISSAFESSVGLAALAQLAAAVDAVHGGGSSSTAPKGFHGLGTLGWFTADAISPGLADVSASKAEFGVGAADAVICAAADAVTSSGAVAGAATTSHLLDVAPADPTVEERRYTVSLSAGGALDVRCLLAEPPAGAPVDTPPIVLLHGFMGDASDWCPAMRALAAAGHRCLAVDLPGHVGTRRAPGCAPEAAYTLDAAADAARGAALAAFGDTARPVLIGYSMGARVALHALACAPLATAPAWRAGVVVSGTPGIPDAAQRADRVARDLELSDALRRQGLPEFVDWWYRQPLWGSLRAHPRFGETAGRRAAAGDASELAAALAGMSTGRMEPLWDKLPGLQVPLLLAAGALDSKFVHVHRRMMARLTGEPNGAQQQRAGAPPRHASAELPNCGHAVHVEAPLQLLGLLREFLATLPGES